MDEKTVTYIILAILGGVFSFLSWTIRSFMSESNRKIDAHDRRMDKLDIKLAQYERDLTYQYQKMSDNLYSLEKTLDKINKRFESQEELIDKFYKENPNIHRP